MERKITPSIFSKMENKVLQPFYGISVVKVLPKTVLLILKRSVLNKSFQKIQLKKGKLNTSRDVLKLRHFLSLFLCFIITESIPLLLIVFRSHFFGKY